MEHLSSKTAKELRDYALENGIDIGEAKTKTKILSILMDIESNITVPEQVVAENIISVPEPKKSFATSNTKSNEDGVITVRSAEKNYPPVKAEKKTPEVSEDKVAVYSEKNLHWQGVGKLTFGYNIITREVAEKWLTNKNVREATPEEVATYYGKA
jgi:hypothetical protein